ncbi:MAG: hypothetical protein WDM81_20830 [Rhizomicrobium sp.]
MVRAHGPCLQIVISTIWGLVPWLLWDPVEPAQPYLPCRATLAMLLHP